MVCEIDIVKLANLILEVLILVLMEYGLRVLLQSNKDENQYYVLILVLMEYGLRGSNL